jgi:hypothetical protein
MTPRQIASRAAALHAIGQAAARLEGDRTFSTMADRIEAIDAALHDVCRHVARAGDHEALTAALLAIGAEICLWAEAITAEEAM